MKRLLHCLCSLIGRQRVRSRFPLNRFPLMARHADPPPSGLRGTKAETLSFFLGLPSTSHPLSSCLVATLPITTGKGRAVWAGLTWGLAVLLPACWLLTLVLIDSQAGRHIQDQGLLGRWGDVGNSKIGWQFSIASTASFQIRWSDLQ